MNEFTFPLFKTKLEKRHKPFSLEDSLERREYFLLKAGGEIEKIKEYLRENTFVAFLLGKKGSGKGTYSKLFAEAVGAEHMRHISVGDIVRSVHKDFGDEGRKKELLAFLKKSYRGLFPLKPPLKRCSAGIRQRFFPPRLSLALLSAKFPALRAKPFSLTDFREILTRFLILYISARLSGIATILTFLCL